MPFHADLHLHSHLSRATSKNLNLEHLSKWAQLKGIRVVGTGDFVHPDWLDELKEKLEPAEEGLFKLKPEYDRETRDEVPPACQAPVRFMLTVEISNIYKRLDKVRKVHNVLFAPGFEAAEKIQARLDAIGNIRADGRPILGLDSRDLLEITLESDPLSYLIPAHIWTPWFSALGSKSGFDRMEDCFGDLSSHIFAVETGLSSDPLMNWRLSQLDPYVLVSNSDAHSPPKLGRETTIYDTDCTYPAIYRALSDHEDKGLVGTMEFFPEEGKYHFDGHRKCEMRMHPQETIKNEGRCPVCGKPVTVGVMARVEELADRPEGTKSARWRPYYSMIPLPEVIAEAKGVGPASKRVNEAFQNILAKLGNEIYILMDAPIEDIKNASDALIAEGIQRMRDGEVNIAPGYDGDYGKIRIFSEDERHTFNAQTSMFGKAGKQKDNTNYGTTRESTAQQEQSTIVDQLNGDVKKNGNNEPMKQDVGPSNHQDNSDSSLQRNRIAVEVFSQETFLPSTDVVPKHRRPPVPPPPPRPEDTPLSINNAQMQAVEHTGSHLLIVAGPGTGKTHTLTHRIAHMIQSLDESQPLLAVTFTNKAATEMRERLIRQLGDRAHQVSVGTFHSVCLSFLRNWARDNKLPVSFSLATPDDLEHIAHMAWPEDTNTQRKNRLEKISHWKGSGQVDNPPDDVGQYNSLLRRQGLLDFDDIILETLKLLRGSDRFTQKIRASFSHIFVDEYQDINAAQQALLKELVKGGHQITAIGDPNQAIYGFRGAKAHFFHSFPKDFPNARVLYLSDNYRSAPTIINASSQVIKANGIKSPVEGTDAISVPPLVARLFLEGRLTIHEASTDKAEAEYVVHQIERLVGGTSMFSQDSGRVDSDTVAERTFGDIAVLYRMNSQHGVLEEAFQRSGIPYKISGHKALIEQPGVMEIATLLRLCHGLGVTLGAAMKLLMTTIPGLGEKTAEEVEGVWRHQAQISAEHLRALPTQRIWSERVRMGFDDLLQAMEQTTELIRTNIAEGLTKLMHCVIWRPLQTKYPSVENSLKKLIRCAQLEVDMMVYLDQVLLSRAYDGFGEEVERVSLMTIHAAKGLEFPVVFIVGCEHELIPLQYPGMDSDVEEERRLFYVGMTRAKEQLYCVQAKRRMLFGNTYQTYPSPFLADIEEQLKHYEQTQQRTRSKEKSKSTPTTQLNLFGE